MTQKTPEEFIADLNSALPDNNPEATVPATFRAQFAHLKDSILFRSNALDVLDAILESTFWRKTELIIDDINGLQDALNASAGLITGNVVYRGDWSAFSGEFPYGGGADAVRAGHMYKVSVAGTVDGVAFQVGDYLMALIDNPSAETFENNWHRMPISRHSPVFTGVPRAPTPAAASNDTQLATTAFVQALITALAEEVPTLEGGTVVYKGAWDASAGTFPSVNVKAGHMYRVSVAGVVDGEAFQPEDYLLAVVSTPSSTTFSGNWQKIDGSDRVLSVAGLTGTITKDGLNTALKNVVSDADDITVVPAVEFTNIVGMTEADAAIYEGSAQFDPSVLIATVES